MTLRTALRTMLALGLGILFLALALKFYQTSAAKIFVIDEFMYTHGAWQIARGEFPYRDFVIHTSPLAYFVYSLPFLWLDDNPANIVVLRQVAVTASMITVLLVWLLTDRSKWGAIGSVLLMATTPFVHHGVEIRRDNIAMPLLLLAIVVVGSERIKPVLRGGLIGVLYGLMLWTNEKTVTYTAPLLAMVLISLFCRRLRDRNFAGNPLAFIGGFAAVSAGVLFYLTLTGSLAQWWEWCVIFTLRHEEIYPGFPWSEYFIQFFSESWLLLLLGGIGAAATMRRYRSAEMPSADLLLLLLLPATFIGYQVLAGPYAYSLMPFQIILSIFAGRGVIAIFADLHDRSPLGAEKLVAAATCALLVVPFSLHAGGDIERRTRPNNLYQLSVLNLLGRLTDPSDGVFDTSGSSVSRPNISQFFMTDEAMRILLRNQIEKEILDGLAQKNCVAFINDTRIKNLPRTIQDYLFANFLPYDGEIGIRGRRYQAGGGILNSDFIAPIDGRYFIDNKSLFDGGSLEIDGAVIKEQIFYLAKGTHSIKYSGPSGEFSLIWLPRDGKVFTPSSEFKPRFSVVL